MHRAENRSVCKTHEDLSTKNEHRFASLNIGIQQADLGIVIWCIF